MKHFVRVQTAPRTLIRDAQGRITGVRVELPQETNAEVTPNTDGSVNVELDE